jgi:hypothetical protein
MPQFDKVTFFHQVFFLLFFFPLFYLLILQNFLPKLSSVLKIRQKVLDLFVKNILNMSNEQNKIQSYFLKLFSSILRNKNIQMFLFFVSCFTEYLKQDLLSIPNKTVKTSFKIVETQLYNQIFLYFFIKKNKIK